jgi:hypothetical protein
MATERHPSPPGTGNLLHQAAQAATSHVATTG